jgi:hypothetical protein
LGLLDWAVRLATTRACAVAMEQWARFGQALLGAISIMPAPNDHRFAGPLWQMPPFRAVHQGCLLGEEWWARATNGPEGIGRADQRI